MKILGIALFVYGFLCVRAMFRNIRHLISFDSFIAGQPWLTEKGHKYTKSILKGRAVLNFVISVIVFLLGYYSFFVWSQ